MTNPAPSDIRDNQLKFADNIEALESLQEARTIAQQTEATLRLGNSVQQKQADEVWQQVLRLNTEIDILSGHIMETWTTDAADPSLSDVTADLDASLAKIKADQDTANQVVQVLGLLDKALGIAVKFLA